MTRQVICLYGIFQTYMEFGGAEMPRQTIKRTGKRGPRPRGPYADKRKTLTTRITNKTRESLDAAAKATDRSLSQEIEFRLERSFLQDEGDERVREATLEGIYDSFGGKSPFEDMRALGGLIGMIEDIRKKSWRDDLTTKNLVVDTITAFFEKYGPEGSDEQPGMFVLAARRAFAKDVLILYANYKASKTGTTPAPKKRRTKKG